METIRERGFFAFLRRRTDVGLYAATLFGIAVLTVQILVAVILDTAIFGPSEPSVQAGPYEVVFVLASVLTILANTIYLVNWFLSKAIR